MIPLFTQEELNKAKHREELALKCEQCSKTYYLKKKRIIDKLRINPNKGPRFCSLKCHYKSVTKAQTVKCATCDIAFVKSQNQITKTNNNFCSKPCAAKLNGKLYKKKQRTLKCKDCDNLRLSTQTRCETCINLFRKKRKNKIKDNKALTLKELHSRLSAQGKHPSWKNAQLRQFNRQWNKELSSDPCHSCNYILHVELCHKKPVSTFPESATLGEINDPSNIIPLCRNCHWELDHGFLMLEALTGVEPA